METLLTLLLLAVFGFALLGLALKALFWLVVLPFKVGVFLLKGIVGLVVVVPLAILGVCAASVVGPVLIAVLAVPLLAVAGIVIGLLHLCSW